MQIKQIGQEIKDKNLHYVILTIKIQILILRSPIDVQYWLFLSLLNQ
ncbi:unnamed protein product [Paramecium sonneborni]|uniref:Uncharacterized protein n=1 Tax=Paramecium sonneborni TaxID=65129 RepID=A0A8S1RD80_9CILI|nr:unnamed protein product [Paramecium sonneborni]